MKTDNPIEEIWRIREEIAAENGYAVDRLLDAMQREQKKYADRLVWAGRGLNDASNPNLFC
jgi:hypothetical protein